MFDRFSLMAFLMLVSATAFASSDYTKESPHFEQHKQNLANYLQFGNGMQACTTYAVAAGGLVMMPWLEDFVVDGQVEVGPFIAFTRDRIPPPDPMTNALFASYHHILTSNPDFAEEYRRYQQKYEDGPERFSQSLKDEFTESCFSGSTREQLETELVDAYVEAAQS